VLLGKTHQFKVTIRPPNKESDFEDLVGNGIWTNLLHRVNTNYWRELAEFIRATHLYVPLGFAVINDGPTVVEAATVRIELLKASELEVLEYAPSLPDDSLFGTSMVDFMSPHHRLDPRRVDIERFSGGTIVTIGFGDIHAGATVFASDPVLVGPQRLETYEVDASLTAKNLASPATFPFRATFDGEVLDRLNQESVEDYWAAHVRKDAR
jgi:hypothetical protein